MNDVTVLTLNLIFSYNTMSVHERNRSAISEIAHPSAAISDNNEVQLSVYKQVSYTGAGN